MNVSQVLNKAADHIERYGHHKGSGFGPGSPFTSRACSLGAIGIAARVDDRPGDVGPAAHALRSHVGDFIVRWNDAPARTAAEVVEALRACAIIEAARETDVRVVEPRVAVSA